MKTFDDIKEVQEQPLDCFMPVEVDENSMGHITVEFEDGKSIYFQVDYDIDAVIDSIVLYGNQYYIYDDYYDVAE